MENKDETINKSAKKERFNQEKECRLLMMCHRFISIEDPFWELLREKLIHMKDLYAGKHSIQLCPVCLTIYVSGNPKKHAKTTIGSLLFRYDPSQKTAKEIAELFRDYGRVKRMKSGKLLVGIPSFGQICIENHRSLEGSTVQSNTDDKNQKSQEFEEQTRETSNIKKRPPERETEQQTKDKSVQNKHKKSLWKHTLKAVIPPLLIHNTDHLNASPFKQNKATKTEE